MNEISCVFLDYAGHRPEASFDRWPSQLLRCGPILPDPAGPALPPSIGAYVERILDQIGASAFEFVFTFCFSVTVGQDLVARIAETRKPPTLVAFDPEINTASDFVEAYHDVIREMSAAATAPALGISEADVMRRPEATMEAVTGDIRARVAAAIGVSVPRPGEDELVDSLSDRYARWLEYVLLSTQAHWFEWGGDMLQVHSRNHPARDRWPGAGRTTSKRFPATHRELLSAPEVHQMASTLVADGIAAL